MIADVGIKGPPAFNLKQTHPHWMRNHQSNNPVTAATTIDMRGKTLTNLDELSFLTVFAFPKAEKRNKK